MLFLASYRMTPFVFAMVLGSGCNSSLTEQPHHSEDLVLSLSENQITGGLGILVLKDGTVMGVGFAKEANNHRQKAKRVSLHALIKDEKKTETEPTCAAVFAIKNGKTEVKLAFAIDMDANLAACWYCSGKINLLFASPMNRRSYHFAADLSKQSIDYINSLPTGLLRLSTSRTNCGIVIAYSEQGDLYLQSCKNEQWSTPLLVAKTANHEEIVDTKCCADEGAVHIAWLLSDNVQQSSSLRHSVIVKRMVSSTKISDSLAPGDFDICRFRDNTLLAYKSKDDKLTLNTFVNGKWIGTKDLELRATTRPLGRVQICTGISTLYIVFLSSERFQGLERGNPVEVRRPVLCMISNVDGQWSDVKWCGIDKINAQPVFDFETIVCNEHNQIVFYSHPLFLIRKAE